MTVMFTEDDVDVDSDKGICVRTGNNEIQEFRGMLCRTCFEP